MYLNNTWKPCLTVIGMDGLPATKDAGNVIRKETKVALSIRLAPTYDSSKVKDLVSKILSEDVPYGAEVEFGNFLNGNGFKAKVLEDWL